MKILSLKDPGLGWISVRMVVSSANGSSSASPQSRLVHPQQTDLILVNDLMGGEDLISTKLELSLVLLIKIASSSSGEPKTKRELTTAAERKRYARATLAEGFLRVKEALSVPDHRTCRIALSWACQRILHHIRENTNTAPLIRALRIIGAETTGVHFARLVAAALVNTEQDVFKKANITCVCWTKENPVAENQSFIITAKHIGSNATRKPTTLHLLQNQPPESDQYHYQKRSGIFTVFIDDTLASGRTLISTHDAFLSRDREGQSSTCHSAASRGYDLALFPFGVPNVRESLHLPSVSQPFFPIVEVLAEYALLQ